MNKKDMISNQMLPGKTKRMLTTSNIADKLIEILPKHIGRKKAITKNNLFKLLFKKSYNEDDIKDWLRWEFVKKALHLLRQRSNCFVISDTKKDNTYIFYVVSNYDEVEVYKNRLKKSIKAMNKMMQRCAKSVEDGWYKQNFELPETKIRKLIK